MKKKWYSLVMGSILFLISVGASFERSPALAADKEIVWGVYADLTGPIATTANNMWEGFQLYYEWAKTNDPIPGIAIKVVWEDTSYSPPKYLTAFKRFQSAGMSLAHHTASPASVSIGPSHTANKIPLLSSGGQRNAIVPAVYEFALRPPYPNYFATAAIQFMKEWKAKGTNKKPKVMFITWDTPYGRGPLDVGIPWAEKQGYEVLPTQLFTSSRPTDFSVQLSAAKEQGADLVYMNSLAGHFAVLLKDAQKLGLLSQMQFCVGSGAGITELIDLAGTAAEGAWSINAYPTWPNDSKGYKWVVEECKRQGKTPKSDDTILGVSYGRVGIEAIRAAAKKVGPEKVDSQALYDALCQMKDLDMWGLSPKIGYAPDRRIPFNYFYVGEVKDQKWRDRAYVEVPWFAD